MQTYKFRVRRTQWLERQVDASSRDEAWAAAVVGDGADFPEDPQDQVLECLTPARGRRPKGERNDG